MKYFYFGLAVLNVIFCMLNIVGSNAIDVILVNIIAAVLCFMSAISCDQKGGNLCLNSLLFQ